MCITNQDQHQMIFNLNTLLQATIWYIPRRDLSCCMQQVIPESREKKTAKDSNPRYGKH